MTKNRNDFTKFVCLFYKNQRRLQIQILCLTFFFILMISVVCVNEGVDDTPPEIKLFSGKDTLYVGDTWIEPGFQASDNVDGDITSDVKKTGSVNTLLIGRYSIVYSVEDKAGNKISKERIINVEASPLLWARYLFVNNANDSGPGKHSLSNRNNAVPCNDRFSIANNAYSFKGKEYLLASASDFPSGNCPKTVSGWFKSNSSSPLQSLFGIGCPKNQFNFQITRGPSTTGNEFRVNGWGDKNDWRTGISAASYFDGKWHHCAVTYDSSVTTFYIDGIKKVQTSGYVYKTDPSSAFVAVGIEADTAGWNFVGDLDDIYIYTRALSELQIKALYMERNWNGDTTKVKTDTVKQDTSKVLKSITGLNYQITTGPSNTLQLKLTWDALSDVQGYGVYFNTGKVVSKNDYYRVALSNSRTFSSELTVGLEYTFAVTALYQNNVESNLSSPITLIFSKN